MRSAHLQALSAVVEHRNFSLAARAQHMSQPSVHRAARELERLIGVPLFEKTSFGITPTREAEKLARRARLAFAEIAQARAEVHALSGGESGRTVIGAMPLARSFLVPTALLEFTQQYPEHSVAIVEGTYEHLLASLRSGEADFLIGALRSPAPVADVVQEHLFDDPLAIIVRAKHPLLAKQASDGRRAEQVSRGSCRAQARRCACTSTRCSRPQDCPRRRARSNATR